MRLLDFKTTKIGWAVSKIFVSTGSGHNRAYSSGQFGLEAIRPMEAACYYLLEADQRNAHFYQDFYSWV